MIYKVVHLLIVSVYVAAPIAAVLRIIYAKGPAQRERAAQRLRMTSIAGISAGLMLCVVYAFALNGKLIFTQVVAAAYLSTAFMLLLQSFDRSLWHISRFVFRLGPKHGADGWYLFRGTVALVLRAAIIFCIGLPYVLATVMTYRPRVAPTHDPQSLYGWTFQDVRFPATDGTSIDAWWIPASVGDGNKTVLLCPGPNSDKASALSLVKQLLPDGYNVLAIDFRDHGRSGGQLCSFGDLERNDVLGAMRWLRESQPGACRKVAGVGISTGGAALLAAAADPSAEGQNIDAIAVYGSFDSLNGTADALIKQFTPEPLSWFVERLGMPMAGLQVGADMTHFRPAKCAAAIWPRPVIVIHGMDDEFVPFEQGQALFDSAAEPKMNFWINKCDHAGAVKNQQAARLVKHYFDSAKRLI